MRTIRSLVGCIAWLAALGSVGSARADEAAVEPAALTPLLEISWRRGPSLPQGFQDSKGGILDNTLISVAGFCSGQQGVVGKPDKYPRGFLKQVWALPVGKERTLPLGKEGSTWQSLSEFPGVGRQGLDAAVVGDSLYCSGGFNYTEPFSYRDAYRLSKADGRWQWKPLPDLPWPLMGHGSCVIDGQIFVLGGGDYDAQRVHTATDRHGKLPRLGARLLMLDTRAVEKGWQQLEQCPGTPRFVHAVAAVAGRLYVFGGAASGTDAAGRTYTVVDNWSYDPPTRAWSALPELPVASGNFPAGAMTYADRFVLLVGGYAYGEVLRPDGLVRASYGTPTRHDSKNAMCSDVFVFDTQRGIFGRATSLPLNNNLPMAVVAGNQLHLIGGEIDHATIEGEHFGHHPDLYLIGTLKPLIGKP